MKHLRKSCEIIQHTNTLTYAKRHTFTHTDTHIYTQTNKNTFTHTNRHTHTNSIYNQKQTCCHWHCNALKMIKDNKKLKLAQYIRTKGQGFECHLNHVIILTPFSDLGERKRKLFCFPSTLSFYCFPHFS